MRRGTLVGIWVLVAVVLLPVLVIGGFVLSFWTSFGGVAHDSTDRDVRAARIKADPTARSDVEKVVTELSPALGAPTKRALIDTCWDTNQSESLNNDITCGRSFYLYYTLPAGEPPAAWNLAKPLTSDWYVDTNRNCGSPAGTTTWCLKGLHSRSDLHLQVNSGDAQKDAYPAVQGYRDTDEMEGYRELILAASTGPCVVVEYTLTYFEG
jgi:hypothetical protein